MSRLTGKDAFGMFEAYQAVYAPQVEQVDEIDEAITSKKGKAKAAEMIAKRSTPSGRAKPGQGASVAAIKHIGRANVENLGGTPPTPTIAKNPVKSRSYGGTGNKAARRAAALKNEEFDIFGIVLEFLQKEGYAETLEEAEWLMANVIDEEAIDIILGEEQLDEISQQTKMRAFKDRATREFESDGDNPKDFTKSGKSKADITKANIVKKHGKKSGEHAERAAHAGIFGRKSFSMPKKPVNEAQAARENPEKYEREQDKKYAPVRGERTPMPPRGNKRREDFEKWYAANVR